MFTYLLMYIYIEMCLLLTAVSRIVIQLYTYDTVTCMCSRLVKNFDMSCGNPVHSNPSTNQLTEMKQSKRKALNRPLERTEPLKRKAGWKTEAQSVKRSTQKKKQPSQVSMKIKTTMITNKKLDSRRPKRMPYKEPVGRDGSSTECKKQPRRNGQKRPKKQREKAALRAERCP